MAEMADTLTCPVCERPGVPLKSTTCPQCDADLTCFQALDALVANNLPAVIPAARKAAEPAAERKDASNTRRAVLLLLLLLALIGAGFFYFFLQTKGRMQELHQQVASLRTDLKLAEQETEPADQILCVLPGLEKASIEKEDESFAEYDPLIYEEDGEDAASSGENTKELAASVSSLLEGRGEEKNKSEEKQREKTKDVLSATGPPQGDIIESASIGETRAATEAVPIIEPSLRKKRVETLVENSAAEGGNVSPVSSALPPEKQWTEKTFLYLVKETDTLWDLAEHFYGDGTYYPVIMEQNPRLVISDIHDEESLRLFNDRAPLKELYTSRIERRDGLTLWKHEVQAGETRQAIEKRFASPGASDRVLYEQEPDIFPGAIVRVILH